jgi:hypothetical protein
MQVMALKSKTVISCKVYTVKTIHTNRNSLTNKARMTNRRKSLKASGHIPSLLTSRKGGCSNMQRLRNSKA